MLNIVNPLTHKQVEFPISKNRSVITKISTPISFAFCLLSFILFHLLPSFFATLDYYG